MSHFEFRHQHYTAFPKPLKDQVEDMPDARPQIVRDRATEIRNCLRAIEEKAMKLLAGFDWGSDEGRIASEIIELARDAQDRIPVFTGGTL